MTLTRGASPASILRECSGQTGLAPEVRPFPREGSLAERIATRPFLMAPMAGVSDAAYRMMARAGGAALAYSEMVSVAGLHYGGVKTWELVEPHEPEPDIAVQLFGSDPEQFREAVSLVCARLGERLVLVDVNMACPVPKVTRKGEGSALLDDPRRAADIVRACISETNVPVTVKIRSARRTGDKEIAPSFARAMEEAGADAVAVHGRTASQMYRGESDWGVVARVARAVTIPVIGTGDVRSAADAARMLRETGASAVMVARGTYGNPWVFDDARSLLAGEERRVHGFEQRLAAFACHVRLLEATGAHIARARSLAGWYLRGMPNAAQWRERAMHCQNVHDYLELANNVLDESKSKAQLEVEI